MSGIRIVTKLIDNLSEHTTYDSINRIIYRYCQELIFTHYYDKVVENRKKYQKKVKDVIKEKWHEFVQLHNPDESIEFFMDELDIYSPMKNIYCDFCNNPRLEINTISKYYDEENELHVYIFKRKKPRNLLETREYYADLKHYIKKKGYDYDSFEKNFTMDYLFELFGNASHHEFLNELKRKYRGEEFDELIETFFWYHYNCCDIHICKEEKKFLCHNNCVDFF